MATSVPRSARLPIIIDYGSRLPSDFPILQAWYSINPHPLEAAPSPASTTGSGPSSQAAQTSQTPRHGAGLPASTPTKLNSLASEVSGLPSRNTGSRKTASSDPRSRKLASFYDIGLLVNQPNRFPTQDIGVLRTKWQQAFQQTGTGAWEFVEYVPAWTDPDWDTRFLYIKGAETEDAVTAQYAKPGTLQTQRPALLPGDAQYRPSDAAKRWGFYPFQAKNRGNDDPDGRSGMTPIASGFPSINLQRQRKTVTVQDLDWERRRYNQSAGAQASDDGFRQAILNKLGESQAGSEDWAEYCRALLILQDIITSREERDEYQRFLLSGNTSNEVCLVKSPGI